VRTLQHCGAWEGSFTVGCSATPYRPNGQSILGPIFEEIVYHKHLLWMMTEGYLCDLVVKRMHVAGMDLKRVRTVAGDYRADDLEAAMDCRWHPAVCPRPPGGDLFPRHCPR
jgi:superfamily II DNA or RNA helicase